jgi:dTDP-D-glucose 4,6-dehydratase
MTPRPFTRVLVTGGAGFIGSNIVRLLGKKPARQSSFSTTCLPAIAGISTGRR